MVMVVREISASCTKLGRCWGRVTLAWLFLWIAEPGVAQRRPSSNKYDHHFSLRRIDSIVKEAESVTYPPDDFYTIVQDKVPPSTPFPCEMNEDKPKWRSDTRPTSVHKLRPGDIDVIVAMGDSITSSQSARERTTLGLIVSDRGVSFTGGGERNWREITTLPNIIKVFNPNLIGHSLGRGDFLSYNAQLNVAVAGSLDGEIMNQIKLFLLKAKRDRRLNFEKDWKMLTIFIGHNNICSFECQDHEGNSPELHKLHLQQGLDYLYKHVPRIFVNIISLVDPTIQHWIPISAVCQFVSLVGCSCMYRENDVNEGMLKLSAVVRKYQEAEKELASSGRYDGRDDFTVEFQPFARALNGPEKAEETISEQLQQFISNELPIWTPDCLHFNQRGMAEASILLWNNLLEPVGNKSEKVEDFTRKQYRCPTKETPYLFTKKNSETFYKDGHQ